MAVALEFRTVVQERRTNLRRLSRLTYQPIRRRFARFRSRFVLMSFVRHAVMLSICCRTTYSQALRSSDRMRGEMFQH
jgi:hypothetical protein